MMRRSSSRSAPPPRGAAAGGRAKVRQQGRGLLRARGPALVSGGLSPTTNGDVLSASDPVEEDEEYAPEAGEDEEQPRSSKRGNSRGGWSSRAHCYTVWMLRSGNQEGMPSPSGCVPRCLASPPFTNRRRWPQHHRHAVAAHQRPAAADKARPRGWVSGSACLVQELGCWKAWW